MRILPKMSVREVVARLIIAILALKNRSLSSIFWKLDGGNFMKWQRYLSIFTMFVIIGIFSSANAMTNATITGKKARLFYNYLIGSSVQSEGAAGHLYRKGKNINCRYTNVDMSDNNGNNIPQHDPRRYSCSFQINHNGYSFPGNHF